MNWFFEHIDLLLPVIIIILYLLGRLRGGGDAEAPPQELDAEAAERARRVREEIRRKMEERQRGGAPQQGQAPVYQEPPAMLRPEPGLPGRLRQEGIPVAQVREVVAPDAVYLAEAKAEREEVEEKLRRLRTFQDERQRLAREEHRRALAIEQPPSLKQARLFEDLHDPEGLRRAVVLREVLGPPLALRSTQSTTSRE